MAKKIIISIIGLVIFVIGAGLGIFYQEQKTIAQMQALESQLEKNQKTFGALGSKLVNSFVVYGQVVSRQGQDITLNNSGYSIVVHIKADAPIYAPKSVATIGMGIAQPQVKITDIQRGASLTIQAKVLINGQLEGEAVTIAPVFNITTPINNKK